MNAIALNTRFRSAELTDVFTRLAPGAIFHQPQYGGIDFTGIVAEARGASGPGNMMLRALPFCGVFGFCQAMGALAVGRPSGVMENVDAQAAVAAIRQHRITHFNATDDMLSACADAAEDVSVFASLRLVGAASYNRGDDRPRRRPERRKHEMTEGEACLNYAKMAEAQRLPRLGRVSVVTNPLFNRNLSVNGLHGSRMKPV